VTIETETWRIEGLKIIGPSGEICTMTWAQGKGGIGAHEILPKQRLIAAVPEMVEALLKAHRALRAFTPADGSNAASLARGIALDEIDALLKKVT
jgi:hypothetical protein